jgi:transposase-like protein
MQSRSSGAVPEETRLAILAAFSKHGSYKATAKALGLSRNTVRRWVRTWKISGSMAVAKRCGRPRALAPAAAQKAMQLLLSNEFSGADHVAGALQSQGITEGRVHKATLIRAAREQGKNSGKPIICMKGMPKPALSANTIKARLAFATANKKRSWDNIMFTDRKRFTFYYPGAKVRPQAWMVKGEKWEAPTSSRPQSLNIYMGITKHGVTNIHIVAGTTNTPSPYKTKTGKQAKNITAQEYRDVLKKTFLPGGQQLLGGRGHTSWVLQQDGDPTHRVAPTVVAEYNRAYSSCVSVLAPWPPHSPDLNIIENVWAWMESRVRLRGCTTFKEFTRAVREEARAVPKRMLTNLYKSMPMRMAEVIRKKGGKTKH